MKLNTICVYCGSSSGRLVSYQENAIALAKLLVERNIGLVYGGAKVGIMGTLADSVMAGGGRVIGVIPESLVDKELAHEGLTELIVTSSMHERKRIMAEKADGFIALPGGFGTLEEIFEVLTWAQLEFHEKPCGLLNVEGYYDSLVSFLNHAVSEEFLKPIHRDMIVVEPSPLSILDRFERYTAPIQGKWITKE